MELVKRRKLSEEVVEKIKQYIIDHRLKPGDRLPTEQEIAVRSGVSRIAVREATKALNFLGILDSAPRRGLTVGYVNMQRLSEYLGFHFAIDGYPKESLLKARIIIEIGALPYAMERIKADPALYHSIMDIIHRMQKSNDEDEFIKADIEFHRALVMASGIDPLIAFTDLLRVFFTRFHKNFTLANRRKGNKHHLQILQALRGERLRVAQKLLQEHLEYHHRHV